MFGQPQELISRDCFPPMQHLKVVVVGKPPRTPDIISAPYKASRRL